MFAGILVLRNNLKKFMKSGSLACLTIGGNNTDEAQMIVKINRVGLFTVDLEAIDNDMSTSIQSATLLLSSITSVRSLSTYMVRIQLMNSNPDLLLEDSAEYLGHDCEEYLDIDED